MQVLAMKWIQKSANSFHWPSDPFANTISILYYRFSKAPVETWGLILKDNKIHFIGSV